MDFLGTEISKDILNDIINSVFWYKDKACTPTPADSMLLVRDTMDSRLQYWKTNLKKRQKIAEKIKRGTGKRDCQLLFNQIHINRDVSQLKRILDYAERLDPTSLAQKELVKLKEIPCYDDVFETQYKSERKLKFSEVGIVGVPKVIKEEEHIGDCGPSQDSWVNSKYLGNKFIRNADQIKKLLHFYPKIDKLQIAGKKAELSTQRPKVEISTPSSSESIYQEHALLKDQTLPEDFLLAVNDHNISSLNKPTRKIRINHVFETVSMEKTQSVLVVIENLGLRVVDFEWLPITKVHTLCLKNAEDRHPTFFFDKNSFRVLPTAKKEIIVTFKSHKMGIFSEKWQLNTDPNLMSKDCKIVVNLFGHCRATTDMKNKFEETEKQIAFNANESMTKEVLKWLAMHSVPDIPNESLAYAKHFTDMEIFKSLNLNFSCTETILDQLKEIYKMHRKVGSCPNWNFNLQDLKNMIIGIEDDISRQSQYANFLTLLETMRKSIDVEGNDKTDKQKFLLVRNILSSTFDKLEIVTQDLENSVTKTKLDLSYNEVVILNPYKVPKEMKMNITDNSADTRSELSFCVVKSKGIKKKRSDLFANMTYIQFYSHLLQAFDEAVCVIEGCMADASGTVRNLECN